MRAVIGMVMLAATTAGMQAQERSDADSARVAAVHALLDLDRSQAWRTDIWQEGDEVVLRVTPANPEAELQRVRPPAAAGPVARVRFDAQGRVNALTVRDTRQPGALVSRTAGASARTAALAGARFGASRREDLVAAARERQWTALGADTQVGAATLVWDAAEADRERAFWRVRLTTTRDGATMTFVATVDPVDGGLVALTPEGSR